MVDVTDDPALRAAEKWIMRDVYNFQTARKEIESLASIIRTEMAEALENEQRYIWMKWHPRTAIKVLGKHLRLSDGDTNAAIDAARQGDAAREEQNV